MDILKKSIKLLQTTVVIVFFLMFLVGLAVLFFLPDRIDVYKKLIDTLTPAFVAIVVPALIGTPLTEGVRNLTTKAPILVASDDHAATLPTA